MERRPMNLAVTGGRDTHVSDEDFKWLVEVWNSLGGEADYAEDGNIDMILLGDCPTGVDNEIHGRLWSDSKLFKDDVAPAYMIFDADWTKHGKAAGPIRNQEMIDEADALAAFPGGRGTADCVRRAKAKGIPIFRRTP
jgi:hypothetical protein